MSLINQVLNDLEQRGARALPDQPAIRPVSTQGKQRQKIVPAAVALILACAAAGLWWGYTQRKSSLPENAATVQTAAQAAPAPQAVAQAVAITVPDAPQNETLQETGAPASHLSFELSSIPPPASLYAKPVPAKTPVAMTTKGATPDQSHNKPAPLPAADNRTPVAAPPGSVNKQIKQVSPQQLADNEFRKANGLMQQGRSTEAITAYEEALQLDASHDSARQALVSLLLESKRNTDAERVLQDGLKHNPKHGSFSMLLARLQVERNELALALETLQKGLPYAERQADYQAFVAALLQRQGRHKEAVAHYQTALQLSPGSGIWLMGLGISLQALQHNEEARDAFKRAIESHTLNAELQAFVSQRLKEL